MVGEITANSAEAIDSVTAALDSVTVINNIVNNEESIVERSTEEKTGSADRNYRHLELMMDKDWFTETATTEQTTAINNAITAGKAYYDANS